MTLFFIVTIPEVHMPCSCWLLNKLISNETSHRKAHKAETHIPSYTHFITKGTNPESVKSQYFFTSFFSAAIKTLKGAALFESDD